MISSSSETKNWQYARVALAGATARELAVDPPRFVAFGADDVQAAQLGDALAELDVGSAAGHVGRDRHAARLARLGDDLGLDLVVLGVQDLVLDPLGLEQGAEPLRLFDRTGADQDRHALLVPLGDLVGDGLKPFFRRRRRCGRAARRGGRAGSSGP